LNETQMKTILSVLWELEKEIDDAREAVFDLDDVDTQVLRLGYHFLKQLPVANRKPFLADLINQAPHLYYPVHLVGVLRQDYDKYKQAPDLIILGDAELKELEQILVGKIKSAATNGTLPEEKGFVAIIYRWKDWESAEVVTEYIRGLVSTRAGL